MVPRVKYCWQSWSCYFGKDCGRTLELSAKNVIEYWDLSELFCRSLEYKKFESNAVSSTWLVKVQREAKTLPGLSCEKLSFWLAGAEVEGPQNYWSETFALLGSSILVNQSWGIFKETGYFKELLMCLNL